MDPVSLGDWLKGLRADNKFSVERLADLTKISPRFLDALERGDPDTLPTRVHARAFALAYARACGADEEEAIQRVGEAFSPKAAAPAPAAAAAPRPDAEARPFDAELREAILGRPRRGWRLPPRWRLWALMGAGSLAMVLALGTLLGPGKKSNAPLPMENARAGAGPAGSAVEPAPRTDIAPPAPAGEGDELGLRARRPCWVVLEIDGKRLPTVILERSELERVRYKVGQKAVMLAGTVGAVRGWWRGENIGYLGELGSRMNGIVFEKGQPWRQDPQAQLALPPGVPSQAE